MTSWSERAQADASLRAWLEASIAKAGLDVHTARVEQQHLHEVIQKQAEKIHELEQQLKRAEKKKR